MVYYLLNDESNPSAVDKVGYKAWVVNIVEHGLIEGFVKSVVEMVREVVDDVPGSQDELDSQAKIGV